MLHLHSLLTEKHYGLTQKMLEKTSEFNGMRPCFLRELEKEDKITNATKFDVCGFVEHEEEEEA